MSFTSSDYTNRLRQRFLYAAKVMQETAFSNGQQIYIQLDGSKKGAVTYGDTYVDFVDGAQETTLAEQQFYISNTTPQSSAPTASVPDAPTGLSATAGITSLIISFTPGADGGSAITNYAYSIDGGSTFTSLSPADTTSPITITGLTANTSYTVVLRAINAIGDGVASDPLSTATVNGPNPPTLTAVLADNLSVWVYFTAPSGTPTNYEYSTDGTTYTALSPADTVSPIRITGLTNGTTYAITLKTVNAVGVSDASTSLSGTPVSPTVANSWLFFDPSQSASYPGTGTTLSNIGSYGTLNGTITNATYNPAVKGGVLDFNGTSAHVSFGAFDFGNTFSITAWIYPRATATINGLLANTGANQSPNGFKVAWNWWMTNSRVLYFENGNGTQGSAQHTVQNLITYDAWQHVGYVLDKTNRRVLFFVNGVPVDMGTGITTTSNFGTNNSAFRIGSFTDSSYRMNAQLGYLKVFNSALDATQLYADFSNSSGRFI